jgi:hypothetical protein
MALFVGRVHPSVRSREIEVSVQLCYNKNENHFAKTFKLYLTNFKQLFRPKNCCLFDLMKKLNQLFRT